MTKTLATSLIFISAQLLGGPLAFAIDLTVETRLSMPKTVQENHTETATAECKGNEVVVGGGFKLTSTNPRVGVDLIRSEPVNETTWEIEVVNNRGGGPQDFVVIARCLLRSDAEAASQEKCCSLRTSKTR